MLNNHAYAEILPKGLADNISIIEQGASHYWENKRYSYYINQSITHTRQVIQKLIDLINILETSSSNKLTSDEKFIVIASAILCDVGLQDMAVSALLQAEPKHSPHLLPQQLASIYSQKGKLTEKLLRRDKTLYGAVGLSTLANDCVKRIIDVCFYCTPETFEESPEILPLNSQPVRIRLLSGLLGLADQLYIEAPRINWESIQISELPIYKYAYFWCYQYVQVMPIENGVIKFSYEIPKQQSDLLVPLRNLFEGSVKYENNRFVRYLWDKYGCKLVPSTEPIVQLSTSHELPPIPSKIIEFLNYQNPAAIPYPELHKEIVISNGTLRTNEDSIHDPHHLLYEEFLLHINTAGYIKATSSEGEISSQFPVQVTPELKKMVRKIDRNQTTQDVIQNCGKHIFDLIFPKEIYGHLMKTEALAKRQNKITRLKIYAEAGDVRKLPLETIFRDDLGIFLATDPNFVLSRYIELPLPKSQIKTKVGAIDLLVMISNPKDQPTKIDVDEWDSHIRNSLAIPVEKGIIKIRTITNVTYENIRDSILKMPPDMIQFIGHGFFKNGKGNLALSNALGNTWLINDANFADIFLGHGNQLRLINLTACESGASNSTKGFVGLAPKLIQRGFPSVVGMQYPISVLSAKIFLENFYTNISAGMAIDWAVQESRKAMLIKIGRDTRDFITPVLYMRSQSDLFI